MPRVLLDLTPLVTSAQLRGIGRYVRGLVQGLEELGEENWGDLRIQGLAATSSVDELLPPINRMSRVTAISTTSNRTAKAIHE